MSQNGYRRGCHRNMSINVNEITLGKHPKLRFCDDSGLRWHWYGALALVWAVGTCIGIVIDIGYSIGFALELVLSILLKPSLENAAIRTPKTHCIDFWDGRYKMLEPSILKIILWTSGAKATKG